MDEGLRADLWNALTVTYFEWTVDDEYGMGLTNFSDELRGLTKKLWTRFFRLPLDSIPRSWSTALITMRQRFMAAEWNQVYDYIEFCAQNFPVAEENKKFRHLCNRVLERNKAGYRFVGDEIAELTSDEEIQAIEEAEALPDKFTVVSQHLSRALALMSDRKEPDFRNSIKESISAVESMSSLLAGTKTANLGAALKILDKRHQLHGALKKGFETLYGFTSDADGVRHALLEESNLTFADAKFMLVTCSAFVNYLKAFVVE